MVLSPADAPWFDGRPLSMLPFMPDAEAQTWRTQLGRAMAAARKGEGMTQEDVAGILSVDPQTISRWETGTNAIKAFDIVRYASAVSMPPAWIVKPPDSIAELATYEQTRKRARAIVALGLSESLSDAAESGVEEGIRRDRTDRVLKAPGMPVVSKRRPTRGTPTGRA